MNQGIGEAIGKMIGYFGADTRRISHALKVYGYAKSIGEMESLAMTQQTILEVSAVLHDIGIPESERKYGSAMGKYQEQEGPPIARLLLAGCNITQEQLDRICYLIGHHHTYGVIDGMDFQILVESDFLVNIQEEDMTCEQIRSIRSKYFKTPTGILYLDTMYPQKA